MAFCRLVFPVLVLSVVHATNVPVFVWNDLAPTTLKSNPLTTLTTEQFYNTLKGELKSEPFTVIFIEETLSVEDFSLKNGNGETSFPYLHSNLEDALYLPSVEDPIEELNELSNPENVEHVKLTEDGLSAEIEPKTGKFVFVELKDAREGESRAELLRRHNDFMENLVEKLIERQDKVLAVYTARYPSWTIPITHSRVRREARNGTSDHVLDGLRLYVNNILLREGNSTSNLSDLISSNTEILNSSIVNGIMKTTLNFSENSITLNFRQAGGYWFFDNVTLRKSSTGVYEELYPTTEVYAILGFSYRCAQVVVFTSVNKTKVYSVTFEDLKVQPYFETTNGTQKFGDSFNCVGFFSVAIWSGLFVVFILLAITFYGIMMMMDIRTMDRFDDPKGKTITINASE